MDTKHKNSRNKNSGRFFKKFGLFSKPKNDNASLKETLDAYFEESENSNNEESSEQEMLLLSNVVTLQDMEVTDVMIPRADVVAVDVDMEQSELLSLICQKQYSRYPVYQTNPDNILGTLHIKDVLAALAEEKEISIDKLLRDVPMTSPAMPVLDLMRLMQVKRRHMVLVVDEHGGIDGLVTIGDITEAILGEIQDEYDIEDKPSFSKEKENVYRMDARLYLEDIEEELAITLPDTIEEDIDTVGGLVVATAGRVPVRGEIITLKEADIQFEILEADPRRIKTIRLIKLEGITDSDGTDESDQI